MKDVEIMESGAEINEKPGYKKTKLGWIPEEWEVLSLRDVSEKIQDGTHFSPKSMETGQYKYLTSKNIRPGYLDLNNINYVSREDHQKIYKRCNVKYGDVLLTKDGANTGNSCLNTLKEEFSLLSSVAFIRAKSNIANNEFIYQMIMSPTGQNKIKNSMAGQAITRITLSKLRKFKFPFPPLSEQKRIASILSSWDKAIELTQHLIEAKEEQKKGLMQRLLTGTVRVKGYCGEWEKVEISKIINESKIKGQGNDVNKRITVRLALKGVEKREVKGNESIGSTNYYLRRAGQFIYGKQNLHKGAMGIIPKKLDGYETTTDIPSFDFKKGFHPKWFLLFFSRNNFYERLESLSTGTGSKRIKPNVLLKKVIKVPKYEEQKAIASILIASEYEIKLLNQKLEAFQEQKKV